MGVFRSWQMLTLLLLVGGCADEGAESDAAADAAAPADLAVASDLGFGAAPHPPLPQLAPNDGKILTSVRVVSVVASGDPLAAQLFSFGDALVSSAWWSAVGADYGLGAGGASLHLTGPALSADVPAADAKAYLQGLATGNAAPDGHSVYVLYLPSGVALLDNSGRPIQGCVGFHFGGFAASGDIWAVIARCGKSSLDAETYLASHEIAEGAADAVVGKGWSLPFAPAGTPLWMEDIWAIAEGHEIGDLCQGAGATRQGNFSYSRIWSNSAAAAGTDPCLPAPAPPYVNVSAPAGWVSAAAGADVTIPLTGWSSAPTPGWTVHATVRKSSIAGFTAWLDDASDGGLSSARNGAQLTLHVQVPPTAVSGDYAAVRLESAQPSDPASFGLWPVGVYVP
jgi:hypothetical protein